MCCLSNGTSIGSIVPSIMVEVTWMQEHSILSSTSRLWHKKPPHMKPWLRQDVLRHSHVTLPIAVGI